MASGLFPDQEFVGVFYMATVAIGQPVYADTGVSLTKRVLPRGSYHLAILVPLPDCLAVVVGQDEAALMCQE